MFLLHVDLIQSTEIRIIHALVSLNKIYLVQSAQS